MTLETMLRERIEQARSRLATAESDLKKWEDALQVELRDQANHKPIPKASEFIKPIALTLEEVRTKTDLIRTTIKRIGKPVSSNELIQAVKPAISRSMVYHVVSQLKESGELKALPDGRLELIQQGVKGQEAAEAAS